nr:Condensation and AMP-dependent synthetase ligase and Phosphopantetheine-binding domain containing protein [Haemonchus contortus]
MLTVQDLASHGYKVDLKTFFSLRTAEKIAGYLASQKCATKMATREIYAATHTTFDIPLSPQQKRLWFLSKMYPERDSYIIRFNVNLKGPVDVGIFKKSFNAVVINNPAMRSMIVLPGIDPILVRLSGTECFYDLNQQFEGDSKLDGSSLVVAQILVERRYCRLDLRIQHLICDGRSLAIIGEQLAIAYNGGQIRSYDSIQHVSETDDSMEFWKAYLKDYEPPVVHGEGDKGARDGEAGYVEVVLDFVKEQDLREVCSIYGCTLYQILVLCYVQTLRTCNDLSDIVIGTTVANRTPENMNIVGLYVETIPLRFREELVDTAKHLRYVSHQILSAMEHQSTPLTRIIEEVVVGRDLGTNPLFRHVLTLESASIKELPEMRGIESKVIEPRTAFTQFDQSWIFHQGEKLLLSIQYDRRRFTALLMREHLNLFKFFLNRLLKQKPFNFPLHLMTASPIHDTPRCKSLGTVFAEQAVLLPDSICLESNAGMLSFQSVLDAARSFAMRIQTTIVQNFAELPRSDDVICLILPESIENHIAMISAHLLGCAYLSLPPDTPTERIDFVLTDCQAQLVVTNLNLHESSVPILPPDISLKDRSRYRSRSCSDSLAYLIYTSGTTGKPKGVCVSHQSTLNMLEHATRLYHFRPEGRVLQFTKTSFDASISNTFGSLLNGGLLSVRDENADVVPDLARRQPIAVLHMTPIVMEMFDEHDLARLSQVELWSFGGESISESTLATMISHGQRLVQLYGPTEATCYQTSLKMKKGHSSTCLGEIVPGLPHILCSFTNPLVTRKSVGQVAFSGENLARGYTSAADQSFVKNPFRIFEDRVLRRNHRLYLVGDRLRRDAGGCLYFLGRYDDQVKVRGHRVHLAEIESEARKIDGITNTAAVIQRPEMGSNQLILFYTGPAKDPFADLQKQFPPSMLPSRVIKVSEFPLTSNMKIDRVKLSSMVSCSSAFGIETKPRDSIERQVLERFQEVLQEPEIGVNTNFFQAGGHSLLVVRLVALLEKSFTTSVSIVKVFEFPCARDLANWIRSVLEVHLESTAFTNVEGSDQPSPLQHTLLRSFKNPKVQALYDISVSVTLKKKVRPRRCVEIVNQLSMIHPSLRTRFIKNGRSYLREILSGTECFQDLNAGEKVTFDPSAKPLFIARLDGDRICITVNHVITDGHSMQVIVTSLMRILKDQKVSMDDDLKLHSWISNRFLQSRSDDLQYWKELLKDFVYNQLPTTFPRLAINEAHARELVISGNWLASTVKPWVERYGCSPFVATLTLLSKTLQLLSCDPQLPIAIGFPVNLRTQELQNSVGYGVNTVVVFLDTHGTPAEVLQKVMAQVAGAMSHAFLPYEELVNLSPSKKLFSVMLTYDSYSIYENEELVVEPAAATVTKFEFSIFVNPESYTIRFEYNRTLFDEEYISHLAETWQNIARNWEYHIPRTVSDPLRIGEAVFDPSDIAKRIVPLPIEDLNIKCSDGLELHYSSCIQVDDAIRRALVQLPRPLHPQKIVFNRRIPSDFPLSSQQLQMYYLSLVDPHAYQLTFLKKFPKTVSAVHLHRALLHEIQRHEALRTVFFEEQGQPKQMVLSMTEAYIRRTVQSTTALRESVEQFCQAPLDHTHCVPIRVMLFVEHDCIVAAMALNHIISDAWSTTILERELSTVLESLQNGRKPFICRQNYTYRDYCQEPSTSTEIDEVYVDQLVSAEDISLDEGRGEVERLQFEFPGVVAQRWTKRCGTSLFVVMLMFISNSIMNLYGLKSVNVGAPHFNRSGKTKSLIGYFLNNLVFHIGKEAIELEGLQTLQRHVTDVLVKNIPFAELMASTRRLRGNLNLKPLFQIYFNCRYDLEVDDDDGHDIMSMLPVTSQFPLEFDLDKCKGGYRITLRIQKCLIRKDGTQLMEDICRQLQSEEMPMELRESSQAKCVDVVVQLACKVLGVGALDQNENFFSAGGNSLQAIAFVEMLEEALSIEIEVADVYQMESFLDFASRMQSSISAARGEAHSRQVVFQEKISNDSGPTVSNTTSLTRRLPRSVSKNLSDNPNISLSNFLLKLKGYGSRNCLIEPGAPKFTYAELACSVEHRAVSIGRSYCQTIGETLRNDTIIPVVGESSASSFISCLSVIAAGAAYLPIDFSCPVERIKLLLKESQAECYLGADVSGTHFSRLSTTSPVRVRRLMNSSAQEDLAYVIYTSGTTGVPKGVCVKQESVLNMMQCSTVDFRLNADDVVYQFTNFVYDNSVLEIFMTLVNGAKLVVATERFTPRRFFSLMDQHGITYCLLFPGIVATFSEQHFRRLADLRCWIVGAEKFPQRMFDMAIEAGVSIIQNYGPTETTAYALTKHMKITDQSNNLGRAIRNTEVMVKEDGELLLKGKGLMRGYFGSTRQDILLEGSWYATGDQVKSLPNGDVLFVGRKDSQVKIRGQRVELSEIEATVSAVVGVKQCAVVFQDQVLLAFITTDSAKGDVVRRILDKCSNSLPSHMRPSHVFPVDEFPLTKNAKVNLALLRENWKKYLWKDRLHDMVEKILEKKVDPELSFIEAGGSTKLAIKLSLLHMSKYGNTFNIAHLLQRPLKDVGADNEQNMFNENPKRMEMVDQRLRKIWQKLLKSNNIQSNDHFYFSGGNSIALIKLLYEINTEFGVHLKIQNLLNSLIFSEMSAMIGSLSPQVSIASTVHDPLAPRFSVVFIHGLYGGSAPYFELIRSLIQLDDFQIITVQHPNTFEFQSDDMKFYESVQSVAERYAEEVGIYLSLFLFFSFVGLRRV